MKQIKIYLSTSILINSAMICCGFLVGQFDGELFDRIIINIEFIGAPDKYLLQAIDTKQNRFSIKTSKTFSKDNTFIIDYNGLTCNESNYYFRSSGIFIILIQFVFKQNNLYYRFKRYDRYDDKLCLSNIQSVSNSNNNNNKLIIKQIDWPDARDLQQMRNQTKIWFGYSNKIINNNNNYDWSNNINNNQIIIGCIRWFIVNNKNKIKLEMKGDNFYNYCTNREVIESICYTNNNQYGECRNRSIDDQHILYCNKYGLSKSSSELNTANHCYRDLSINNINLLNSYEQSGYDTKSIIVKLAWITQQSINQCLMEIITRNNSLIEIYLDSSNQIILAIKYGKSINWSKYILFEILSNQIHILRIEFTESNSTFKVSNGYFIKTLILPQLGSVKLINVGWNFETNLCQKLTTKFVFRYDSKQFKLVNDSNVYGWIIFLIMIILVLCLTLICIGWIIGKIKKQKEDIPRSTLNIYEEPIEMNNLTSSTHTDIIEERIDYFL